MIFRKNRTPQPQGDPTGPHIPFLAKIPILGELYQLGPVIPKLMDLLKDNKGKMSSKRFGAGALVAAGIVLVQTGAAAANAWQFYGGLALCGCGVALFGLTRWEGGNGDEPPTAPAS